MAYQEPKKRTIRLDDDVYEALRKLPESPNKFLRRVLSAGDAFTSLDVVSENRGKATTETFRRAREPLLKPSERGKK